MKKIITACLLLIAFANAGNQTFKNLHKCTKLADRLICSQGGMHAEGFVYLFKEKRLYVYEASVTMFGIDRTSSKLFIRKAESYRLSPINEGRQDCEFFQVSDIEEFYCDRFETKHYFKDKYGFGREEILKDKSYEYCDEMFNKLLP